MVEMNLFYEAKDENSFFDIDRYVTHMRMANVACGGVMKKILIHKPLPGKGYGAYGSPTWPQWLCVGTLYFDKYEDYEEKFLPNLTALRQDVQFYTDTRAFANFYEVIEVSQDPLNEEEQAILNGYMKDLK